jgi:uncharacterized membrane protein
MEKNNITDIVPKDRLLALSDGVFAIVMTLLVLEIKLPDMISHKSDPHLLERLIQIAPKLEIYVITFLIIGVFWIIHHYDFHFVQHVDRNFIWYNILLLLFISLIPFSSDLLGEYPFNRVAAIIFGINMLAIWLIISGSWRYATRNNRLVNKDLDKGLVDQISKRNHIITILFLIATAISVVSVNIVITSYILIPLIVKLYGKKMSKLEQVVLNKDKNEKQASA